MPYASLKWRNQGAGVVYREETTNLGERGGRRLGHTPPTHWCVVAAMEGETCACGRLDCLMPEIFPLVGRSGRGDSNSGVAGLEKLPKNLFGSRGDLMVAEDSRDEGEVAGVRYDPLDGLPDLEPWKNPNPSLPWL